jgi:hypothetical protein
MEAARVPPGYFYRLFKKRSARVRTSACKSGTVLGNSTKPHAPLFRAAIRVTLDFLADYGAGVGAVALVLLLPSTL